MIRKKGFFQNIHQFRDYIITATKYKLKSELSDSYIGYLWWVLEPLIFMLIYTVVVTIVFAKDIPNAHVYILSALMAWKWFSACVNQSVNAITSRMSLIEQVYVPKYILPQIDLFAETFKFLVSMPLVIIIMLIAGVPVTWHIVEMIPIALVMVIFLYGVMTILSHIGVYFNDIKNIVRLVMRFLFFLSPVMYGVETLSPQYQKIWWLNPMTTFGESFRNIFYRGQSPEYGMLLIWLAIGVVFIVIGVLVVGKYDTNYAKAK